MGNKEILEQNKLTRIGEFNFSKYKSRMTIIEYKNANDITVEFDNGYKTKTIYSSFKKGKVSNPYDKSVCGIGYLGEGKYKTSIGRVHTREYHDWLHIIQRCYNNKNLLARPTYGECEVSKEWLNFQVFAEWHRENFYKVDNEVMSIDKDILVKGNKLYSKETCIFAPKRINNLFETKTANTSTGVRGVNLDTRYSTDTYYVNCGVGDSKRSKYIGSFKSLEDAFIAYKNHKEQYIKQVADEYRDKIPKKLYDAMHNYVIEITDK